jgi:hypothetical protein
MEIRKQNHARFEIPTAVLLKNKVFLDFMHCQLVNSDYLPINMVYHSKALQSSTNITLSTCKLMEMTQPALKYHLPVCHVDTGSYIQHNNFGHNVSYFLVYSSYTSVIPPLSQHVTVIFILFAAYFHTLQSFYNDIP